jgi:DNA-binding MarR family transcriptional regulator
VDKGFIVRMQNPTNRRVINIMLTDEARLFLSKMKDEILGELVSRFSEISDEEMEQLYSSILNVSTILKKVMT